MNEVLKQRLVGALILVALGVVFWPIIFVEPGERGGAEEARIPPRPVVDTSPVEAPDMAGLRPSEDFEKDESDANPGRRVMTLSPQPPSQAATASSAKPEPQKPVVQQPKPAPVEKKTAAAKTKTRTEAPVRPALDADGIPITWILRVASVSNSFRADELRKRLLDLGHKAYVKKVRSGDKTLYRVYVGPKVEKAKLEKTQAAIDAEFGVTTMITRYYP